MKKKFLPYLPARLVKGSDRWLIQFYQTDPSTGKRKRIKQTFELNRIKNLQLREQTGYALVTRINELLPKGYPFLIDISGKSFLPATALEQYYSEKAVIKERSPDRINILDAIEIARKIHCQTDRRSTINCYNSHARQFCSWIESRGVEQMELKDFNAKMAGEYMDYWILEKKVRNTTYNNKLMFIKILFTTLVEREYILKNPFRFIKPKKAIKKLRRNFNDEEKLIISSYIKKHDTWLYYGLILQYYCFIRPTELRRLKFKDFDLQNGIIQLTEETTKSRKAFPVTIPNFLRDDFLDPIFKKQPADYFVFGSGLRPDPLKPCSKNTMNYRHRQILERLLKMKKLKSIEGLSWYSWKDTGLTDLAGDIAPRDLQEQARHYSFDVTETYLHRKKVIQSIQNLKLRRI